MFDIHMSLLVRHTGKRPFFLDSWEDACTGISVFFPKTLHPAFILIETSCFVLFSIAIVCHRYLKLVTFSISVPFICMLSVVLIFVINLVFPLCILRPKFNLFSFTVFT